MQNLYFLLYFIISYLRMSGWNNQGQGNLGQGNKGWGQQGGQQGWGGQQGGQQGWNQQGGQQGQQGWNQGQQGGQQGWNQGQQGGQQGWNQQGQQGQQSWGQQGQQGWGGNQGASSLFAPGLDYIITSALDNSKALDVSLGTDKSKYHLLLWSRHGNNNQRFKIREVGGGKYQILSNLGGTVEVPNGSTANGIQIYISQPNNV